MVVCVSHKIEEKQQKLKSETATLSRKQTQLKKLSTIDTGTDLTQLRKELQEISNQLEKSLLELDSHNKTKYALSQYKAYLKYKKELEKWSKKLKQYNINSSF